jgi:hypothetical protein
MRGRFCSPFQSIIDFFKPYFHKPYLYFCFIPFFFYFLEHVGLNISTNAYFYTLSTISQVLASLIALIGAFVIFKRDNLKTKKQNYLHNLHIFINNEFNKPDNNWSAPPYHNIPNLINIVDYNLLFEKTSECLGLINEIENHPVQYKSTIGKLNKHIDVIKKINIEEDQISAYFDKPAKLGLISIAFSILMLSFGDLCFPLEYSDLYGLKSLLFSGIVFLSSFKLFAVGVAISIAFLSLFEFSRIYR